MIPKKISESFNTSDTLELKVLYVESKNWWSMLPVSVVFIYFLFLLIYI